MTNYRKVVMIGCGYVGSASVFSLMQSGLFSEIAMIDVDTKKAEGEAMDIGDGIPFVNHMKIYAGDYSDVENAGIVIITAGANQKPNETRLDLVQKNVAIFKQIIPSIMKNGFDGILLIVANPVDILTYVAQKLSGLPINRVIGSGTVLDTARLKQELSEHLEVDGRSVHAFIVGEHGDSEIAAWSSANVSGIPIHDFCEMRGDCHSNASDDIGNAVKNSAYDIIQRKQATYYGVAMAVKRICQVIVRDEKSILPVSALMQGEYGIEGVVLSMPCIVGKNGIETKVPLKLTEEEKTSLRRSAQILGDILASIEI